MAHRTAPPSSRGTAASTLTLGLVILAAGHLVLYLLLTADARSALAGMEREHDLAQLERVKDPGSPPQPGGEAYSAWLKAYETWWASKDFALHDRHESLVRTGMILSFLVGLGLLGQGLMRVSRVRTTRERRPQRAAQARRPARVVPLRPVARSVAVRPLAVRPLAVPRRKSA